MKLTRQAWPHCDYVRSSLLLVLSQTTGSDLLLQNMTRSFTFIFCSQGSATGMKSDGPRFSASSHLSHFPWPTVSCTASGSMNAAKAADFKSQNWNNDQQRLHISISAWFAYPKDIETSLRLSASIFERICPATVHSFSL